MNIELENDIILLEIIGLRGIEMDEIIKLLDPVLDYIRHEIEKDIIYIYVKSNREGFKCPHCGKASTKVHSRYERSFQDLPIQGYKVVIVLTNRKFFCKVDKVKGLTKTVVEKVYTRNELFKQIIELVWAFRNLIKNQQVEYLEVWISKAKKLNISEINSFLNGILRDIDAVKNAIIYNYNNGLAEGKVNKIKVTKRIMYGRCGFDLLKKKSLMLEF